MSIEKRVEEDKTYVLYKPGEPTREKYFKLKDLKGWGLSLYYGAEIGGGETYFLASDEFVEGDIVEYNDVSYRIERVIEKLPKRSKVLATISDEGLITITLMLYNEETGEYEEIPIYESYADALLERIAERNKLGEIKSCLTHADVMSIFEKGECVGIGMDINVTIPKYKRAFRAARKLLKELPTGEFRIKICDIENYRAYLKVPTLELLNVSRAKEVDSILGMLARPEV